MLTLKPHRDGKYQTVCYLLLVFLLRSDSSLLLLEPNIPFHLSRPFRAEPLLARIKADRTVLVSPVFDKIHFDDLQVEKYIPFSHGFDWALWCMYESFSPNWLKMEDESQPGKYVI